MLAADSAVTAIAYRGNLQRSPKFAGHLSNVVVFLDDRRIGLHVHVGQMWEAHNLKFCHKQRA